MIRLAWLNRFLTLLVFLLFFFVMTVGSIIVSETSRSSQSTFFDTSMGDQVKVITPARSSPAHTSDQYKPAPASASVTMKQLYHRMNNQQDSHVYIQPASSSQSSNFDEGYDWAVSHKVKQLSQCSHFADESFEGCKSFVEVSHYVKQTQSNLNL